MGNFELTAQQKTKLLDLARKSIRHTLDSGKEMPAPKESDTQLKQAGACFVTLTIDGQLRGCIGSLEPHRPLIEDVCANACSAAFRDPRFEPLSVDEFDRIHIEISVLGPLAEISFSSEQELLQQIVPDKDGLVLEVGDRRGTFLPLVWEQLPDKKDFLAHLKMKAGLPADYWSDALRCYCYHTLVFEE